MTRDRFLELAEAYGGAVARWPAAEREAAATLMAAEPEFVRQSLAAADRLDAVLGAWAPLSVPHGLREAVICLLYTSPSPRDRTRSRMPSSA